MKIKCIIFDMDGVLLESVKVKTEAFAEIFRPHGPDVEAAAVRHHEEHGGVARHEKFRYLHKHFFGINLTEYEIGRLADLYSAKVFEKVLASRFVPGALEFLTANRGKYKFYVSSGTPQEELRRITAGRNMDRFFEGVYGSPTLKTEHIRSILAANNYAPKEVVFVGDALTDRNAARETGLHFVARKDPAGLLSQEPILLHDLHDLARIVAENFEK